MALLAVHLEKMYFYLSVFKKRNEQGRPREERKKPKAYEKEARGPKLSSCGPRPRRWYKNEREDEKRSAERNEAKNQQ
jgi:hypothetical protein